MRYHWIKLERTHRYFPFDLFTVFGRVNSIGKMIGYITKEARKPMYANIRYGIYSGDHELGIGIDSACTLDEAKRILRSKLQGGLSC